MEWVCGFLLTLQGPLYPTPARKQIKLQFHHLEGAVSCPKAAPRLPTYTLTHTKLYTSASSRGPRRPPPKCQPLSTARLPGGMEGFEGRKRARGGMGGCRRGLGVRAGILLQFHPTEIFCSREERTGRETDGGGKATRLWQLHGETPAETLHASLDNKRLYAAILAGHHHLFKVGISTAEGHQQM